MDVDFLITAGVVLILGAALQSVSGFGFGMFAIPLLILAGCRSYEAIMIVVVGVTVQTTIGVYQSRMHIDWKQLAALVVLAGAMIPVGVFVQYQITQLEPDTIRQIFGGIVLAALITQWLWRVTPRERLHWGWSVPAMFSSGFMAGLAGMGGPPAVMWVMAHDWSSRRSRATLWALFASYMPLELIFLYHRFGEGVLTAAGTGLLLAPLTVLGIIPGLWIGHRVSKEHLRRLSYLILLCVSLYAIVQPMVKT